MADDETLEARQKETTCSTGDVHKRAPKYTEKGLEEHLHRQMNARRAKLSQLTAKMNKINVLMKENEDADTVDDHLNECSKLLNDFDQCNEAVLILLSKEEREADQTYWFLPKREHFTNFMVDAEKGIISTRELQQDDVGPDDSASMAAASRKKQPSSYISEGRLSVGSGRSKASSTSSARHKEQAERAALLAKAASLKAKQALEMEELKLKARKEQLDMETAIAASTAKIKVLEECEYEQCDNKSATHNEPLKLSSYQQPSLPPVVTNEQLNTQTFTRPQLNVTQEDPTQQMGNDSTDNLCEVMLKQNDITELLVKQQRLSNLPQRDVPIFSGDPLEFKSFLRAFEHTISDKTDNDSDRIYYLEQFTRGEPRDLVRSCQHMSPQQGYTEAMKLLQYHYGNEIKIATAYLNRAVNWPQVKADDAKALHSYSLFLTGCNNAMKDINHLEELDNPTNLRLIVSKLPHRMREMWRVSAFDIQETSGRRARFADLVRFLNRQAKIASDPLFGDIKDSDDKGKQYPRTNKTYRPKGSAFATSVAPAIKERLPDTNEGTSRQTIDAFQRPCTYCEKNHTFAECQKIRKLPHKERIEFLKGKGLCFSCLSQGHLSKDCKKRIQCDYCPKRHPSMLHYAKAEDETVKNKTNNVTENTDTEVPSPIPITGGICGATGAGNNSCVLAIVPVHVKLKKNNKTVETYAFLDNGSEATFCSEKLMRQLGTEGKKTKILLRTMGQKRLEPSYLVSGLEVCGVKENVYIDLPDAYTHRDIPVTNESIPVQRDLEKWPNLHGVDLPKIDAEVGLLIGTNAHKAMEPWEIIHSVDNGPYAVRTILGWVINGPLKGKDFENEQSASVNRISMSEVETMCVQQFNHDFPERACEERHEMSREDIQFINSVKETVKKVDGHYSISLPLRSKSVTLPNNRTLVLQRAENLKRKLLKNKDFHIEYKTFMSDLLNKGYAVPVSQEQLDRNDGRVWYIPHHGVYHPQKRKLRVVFDCAASYQGKSLNAELLQGPDLTNTLIGVLTRFRHDHIALMSDIEAMYHQVQVPLEDTDMLRFLWWPEGDLNKPSQEFKMTVHLFGATSSPSCANYALKKTAEDAADEVSTRAVSAVLNNFYVDDCLLSVSNESEACTMVRELTELCASGGFRLTKWNSNSRAVLASIPETERASEVKALDLCHDTLPDERVLGVNWCIETDSFKVRINAKPMTQTRRGILSFVSSIYDPLGFLSPVILPAKIILQELCGRKFSWDEDIPADLIRKSLVWLSDFMKLQGFTVDRCFKPESFGAITSAQLHHFADASEKGYGVVTYLRVTNEKGKVHCSFVIGKSRVSPLKQTTIPRLELTAAAVAVKMDKLMNNELKMPLEKSMFWTDSTTVLRYIANDSVRFKTFVANRVSLIRDHSNPSQWQYVNTELNPADCASRGMKATEFIANKSWIKGPDFLSKEAKYWPVSPILSMDIHNDTEVKVMSVNVVCTQTNPLVKFISYYSDWHKLKKASAWMLRLRQLLQKLCHERKTLSQVNTKMQKTNTKLTKNESHLTAAELENAEIEIIKFCQSETFGDEITTLQKGGKIKRTSHIVKLDPVLDNGVLRVGGRLQRSALPFNVKHPIILHQNHHVSILILRHIHKQTGHSGRNIMLSKLREKFWIPKADSALRKILSKCVQCRMLSGKPGEQRMASLPQDRLVPDNPPFTNVGIDYFGPFEVKCGRSYVKRYGVLFTCLTTRAIHIEVAHSLETDTCINAFRRFVARRGQVSLMRSDNGQTWWERKKKCVKRLKVGINLKSLSRCFKRVLLGYSIHLQDLTLVGFGRDRYVLLERFLHSY